MLRGGRSNIADGSRNSSDGWINLQPRPFRKIGQLCGESFRPTRNICLCVIVKLNMSLNTDA